jgi:thiol-disulfide isomerase/thioredoxin
MSNKPLLVHVFGKKTCAKCAMLNKRLDELLTKDAYKGRFVKVYNDLETEDGLVNFCLAQCLNPNRVPGMVIARVDDEGKSEYIPNPDPDGVDPVCKRSKLYTCLGIQTDYSAEGKGIITPQMIQSVLDEALTLA